MDESIVIIHISGGIADVVLKSSSVTVDILNFDNGWQDGQGCTCRGGDRQPHSHETDYFTSKSIPPSVRKVEEATMTTPRTEVPDNYLECDKCGTHIHAIDGKYITHGPYYSDGGGTIDLDEYLDSDVGSDSQAEAIRNYQDDCEVICIPCHHAHLGGTR